MTLDKSVNCNLEPLKEWYCDSCGEVIETSNEGWLEWYHNYREISQGKGFRIVHHNDNCMYDSNAMFREDKLVSGMHLDRFIGADGLVNLLSKIQYDYVENNAELVEIIRRLHIPYYEEARKYHQEAEIDGYFDGENETIRYIVSTSIDIINKYNSQS